ncbi:MAG TPA: hypothetical protein VLK34_08940 [Nocardioidaceae bacterium]|nr:hypothetical protein [Nocardioidaceae bacterium]
MRRLVALLLMLAGSLAVATAGIESSATADVRRSTLRASPDVTVELDQDALTVGPGAKVRFESTVANESGHSLSALVAHLSILSIDAGVYVDPEDWSSRRTQYIDELPAGGNATLTWEVRAVTAGPMVLYVGVSQPDAAAVATSAALNMTVSGKREVQAANAIPLIVGVPALVVVLLGLVGLRARRLR